MARSFFHVQLTPYHRRNKRRKPLRLIRKTASSILSLSVFLSVSTSFATEPERQFGSETGAIVSEAISASNAGDNLQAVKLFETALSGSELNPYERSTIYQMLGQSNYQLDRLNEAQNAFENAINSGGLLPQEVANLNVSISKLMIGNGQIREGANRLESYLKSGGEAKPEYIQLIISAWLQIEDLERARPWAEDAFRKANPKTRKHFDQLNYIYHGLKQHELQSDIVKQMIERWPSETALWESWASLLSQAGRDGDAFEVNKMLYLGGAYNTEADLQTVIQYYAFNDMPYQAAEILEREFSTNRIEQTSENLQQLSDYYRQAREYKRAIPILERAAKQSGKAKTYAELGEALYNEGECERSETAFKEAMSRGYDAGKSWMLIASCRYDLTVELERSNCQMTEREIKDAPITKARLRAIDAFNKVPISSREHKSASKWIGFIQGEGEALERRCKYEGRIRIDGCFSDIRRAYDAMFLIGDFVLADKTCSQYKQDYDVKYRSAKLIKTAESSQAGSLVD